MSIQAISSKVSLSNWAKPPKDGVKPAVTGATALLWRTVEGKFLVTAYHVWHELHALVTEPNSKHVLYVHGQTQPHLIPNARLVGGSESLDLAVITFDGIESFEPDGKMFYNSLSWPVPRIRSGESILFCGFPGAGRIVKHGNYRQHILGVAFRGCDVSKGDHLIMASATGDTGVAQYYMPYRPKEMDVPGVSGAPVFAAREGRVHFVGVVIRGILSPNGDLSIQARPTRFINADGSICPD